MVNILEVKNLCEDHTECLYRTRTLERGKGFLKVVSVDGREFALTEEDIKALVKCTEERGKEIEIGIQKLFNQII